MTARRQARKLAADMLRDLIIEHLADPASSWSCGRFGAVAEFHRDAGEPAIVDPDSLSVSTTRGALRIDLAPAAHAVAWEAPGSAPDGWTHGVALCLPRGEATLAGHTTITELGPDRDAVRAEDRDALLFDLGLGGAGFEICVRSAAPAAVAALRAACGRAFLSNDHDLFAVMPRLAPHRVFRSRLGRVEVFQPIPPPDGVSPEGPHTHVLPKLLAQDRDQAATVPVPDDAVAGLSLFPAHPLERPVNGPPVFDPARHVAFQELMRRHGHSGLLEGKRRALAGDSAPVADRWQALGFRVGQRQARWLAGCEPAP